MKDRAHADKQAESPGHSGRPGRRHASPAAANPAPPAAAPLAASPGPGADGFDPFDAHAFASALEHWFDDHGRHDLPWRRTTDPYAILVSELMLQQTQVATVVGGRYLERWLEAFPNLASLAAAPEAQVLKAWEGLGYYRRARTLQSLARHLVEQQGPDPALPAEPDQLAALPGIGPYTAGAVASLAFHRRAALVDGNVARILARLFDWRQPIDDTAGTRWCWRMAGRLVAACRDPRSFNSALMELGQRVCLSGRPRCGDCPVRGHCRAAAPGNALAPAALPVRRPRPRPTEVEEAVLWQVRDGRLLLQRIAEGGRRAGLWQLPAITTPPTDRDPLCVLRYGITRYRVRLSVFGPTPGQADPEGEHLAWLDPGERAGVAIAAPYLKAIRRLEEAADGRLPGF